MAPLMVGTANSVPGNLNSFPYREVWCCDFEFHGADGGIPVPVCMVAKELRSGRVIRMWQDGLQRADAAPFDTGPDTLFVAYYASAEIGCFLVLGWPPPERILDLFTEFRAVTNGLVVPHGNSLLGALAYFGQPAMGAEAKTEMRDLILSGGPWDGHDREAILDYCQGDVEALQRLISALAGLVAPDPDNTSARLGQALLRGRYMAAVASMENIGVPIDVPMLERLRVEWDPIKASLISAVDTDYGVYEGSTFKLAKFEAWLVRKGIPWPRLTSGTLAMDDDTFRQMARAYPLVAPLHELRHSLSKLKLNSLQVGDDGRNRCLLSPFRSKTGRNQPSNAKFIFGPSRWLRGLIKPAPGYGISYLDFGSQEIAIAAALSGDGAMVEAYTSGDPYMTFAKQAGLAPAGATKDTHKDVRNRCKAIVLGVGYGMGAKSMACRAGLSVSEARELLRRHHETYRKFWQWAENNVNVALAGGTLTTVYGWPIHSGPLTKLNDRSLLNFPMQANGAEMMRLAACMGVEAGLRICAPIHDALLLESPLDRLEEDVFLLKGLMVKASEIVMQSLACRVDAEIVRYPDRYRDEGGGEMWDRVMALLSQTKQEKSQ
jgi:DNA polymerase-1